MNYQEKKQTYKPKPKKAETTEAPLLNEVKHLQLELRKAQLHNKLINKMIDIADEQLKTEIRKKIWHQAV